MVLGVLGLDPVAEAVYAALLQHPKSDLSGLQAVTQLTEAEVRAALDDLADRAFVRPSRDIPGGLRIVSPQIALDLMVRRQEEDLARRAQELAASKAAAAPLRALGATTSGRRS
ncbi:hypothetical protein [Streptomyces camelliae]|uniref:Uncharacterized protein n=1 Tax=Streptomyces camelliae TaxID=3004093 RepID=A0ABY7PFY9_9ACTN|nr:hypothetical protein [Streptomyces sp. HUAS 2-6]WBO69546.1 hypothetical protein O1G22_43100 [Streptomyces sp. HUAS 2-6]